MIDLETLDINLSAVILSIGAVRFLLPKKGEEIEGEFILYRDNPFYEVVDINDQLYQGRTVSGDTIRWWMVQDPEVQTAAFALNTHPLKDTLHQLFMFVNQEPDTMVWGNGANFDISILEHAYQKTRLPAPWGYNNVRCYRTLKTTWSDVPEEAFQGMEHNALDDAINQALHTQRIYEIICDRRL